MPIRFARLATVMLLLSLAMPASGAQPEAGTAAPGFKLQDQRGDWHTLSQYAGRWVALYFYPKNDTPGCTTEACAFRDNIFAFDEIGAVVVGVSLDDVESHAQFAEKYSLPFTLLSDAEGSTAESYGVLRKIGNFSMARRESFLIAPDGTVAKHYEKVNPETHTEEVLADLKMMMSTGDAEPAS